MSSTDLRVEDVPWGTDVQLLGLHPAGLIAVSKPEGVLSHPNQTSDQPRSLVNAPYSDADECYSLEGSTGKLWLLHRLDGATSGVLLLATNAEAAAAGKAAFADRGVRKTYRALVFGAPASAAALWTDQLATERRGGIARTSAVRPGSRHPAAAPPAETDMKVIWKRDSEFGRLAQLELTPHTGRTHQLRVQCQKRRVPIIGDQTYGDFKLNRAYAKATGEKRLHLHAWKVRLELTVAGKRTFFAAECPLPEGWA